jgi:hypothetical protein
MFPESLIQNRVLSVDKLKFDYLEITECHLPKIGVFDSNKTSAKPLSCFTSG